MSLHSVAQPERSQALVGAEDVFLWRFSGDSQSLVGAAPTRLHQVHLGIEKTYSLMAES